jgi:leucyl-tRNA synthetase
VFRNIINGISGYFFSFIKKDLAYRKKAPVNWCPKDQTVLANEQVLAMENVKDAELLLFRKILTQWFFKITEYAEELLHGLIQSTGLIKQNQCSATGLVKVSGAEVDFKCG